MNPSHFGLTAADVASAARNLWRRPHIMLPAAALAAASLAAPAIFLTLSAEPTQPHVVAKAGAAEARPAKAPQKPAAAAVVEAPVAQTSTAELKPAEARAPRITKASAEMAPTPDAAEKLALLGEDDPRWGGASNEIAKPVEADELRSQLTALKQPAADAADAAAPVDEETSAAAEAEAPDPDATGAITATAYAEPEKRKPAAVRRQVPQTAATSRPEAATTQPTVATTQPTVATTQPIAVTTGPAAVAPEMAAISPQPLPKVGAKQAAPSGNVRTGRINTFVNMRSGPENEASVLTVVPQGAEVGVIGGCKHWCQVTYQGRRGYVYKSFISGS